MVKYRRNFTPGGTFFFTATLKNRRSRLLLDKVDLLRQSFETVKKQKPFYINSIVILPDHIHTIWTLPPGDKNYADRWRLLKNEFTRACKPTENDLTKNKRGEYPLWQSRFWEHTIRDENDLENHINYIHYNPVKHGLAASAKKWPYSSFHRYVKQGILPDNWGGETGEFSGLYGE